MEVIAWRTIFEMTHNVSSGIDLGISVERGVKPHSLTHMTVCRWEMVNRCWRRRQCRCVLVRWQQLLVMPARHSTSADVLSRPSSPTHDDSLNWVQCRVPRLLTNVTVLWLWRGIYCHCQMSNWPFQSNPSSCWIHLLCQSIRIQDVTDFYPASGRSGIRPFLANLAQFLAGFGRYQHSCTNYLLLKLILIAMTFSDVSKHDANYYKFGSIERSLVIIWVIWLFDTTSATAGCSTHIMTLHDCSLFTYDLLLVCIHVNVVLFNKL